MAYVRWWLWICGCIFPGRFFARNGLTYYFCGQFAKKGMELPCYKPLYVADSSCRELVLQHEEPAGILYLSASVFSCYAPISSGIKVTEPRR